MLYRNTVTSRRLLHPNGIFPSIEPVANVVPDDCIVGLFDGVTALFGTAGGVLVLHAFLQPIASVGSPSCARHGCQIIANTPSDLIAQQPPQHATHHCAGNTIFVLHWRFVRDSDLIANLFQSHHTMMHRANLYHLCISRFFERLIAGDRSNRQDGSSTDDSTNNI